VCVCVPSCEADLFIVTDLTCVPDNVRVARTLRGSLVAVPQFLITGGAEGPCIGFRKATSTRRWFWVSPGMQRDHAEPARVLSQCAAQPGSSWTELPSIVAWWQRVNASTRQNASCIAVVSHTEKSAHRALRERKYVMVLADVLTFLEHVDHGRTSLGIGQS
jgi:hypothetical protein